MRYELGIAASIMATLCCFQVVCGGDSKLFWNLCIFLSFSTLFFFVFFVVWHLVSRFVCKVNEKFSLAENLWLSFCFGFWGESICILLIKLLFI